MFSDVLDDLSEHKVFVHKDEEETFEKSFNFDELVVLALRKDLICHVSELFCLVDEVFVHISYFADVVVEHISFCCCYFYVILDFFSMTIRSFYYFLENYLPASLMEFFY